MLFSKWEPNYYYRPISYRSYYPRQVKPEVLKVNDPQTQETLNLLRQQGQKVQNLGGLARGIRFDDIEVGRRHYDSNKERVVDEFFIHQWKPTNDRAKEHPVGTHAVFKTFPEFLAKLKEILEERKKKY